MFGRRKRQQRAEPDAPVAAHRTHVSGAMDADTSEAALDALLAELDSADEEHPDVSVTHVSEWCLSVFANGRLVWENAEEGEPRHLPNAERQQARRLLGLVARGDLTEVERMDWQSGYGE